MPATCRRARTAAAPGGMWQPLPAVVAEAARDVAQQLASSAAGASAAAWEAAASPAAVAMCARAQFYGPQFGANPRTPPTLALSLSLPQCRTAATCRDSPAHSPHLVPVRGAAPGRRPRPRAAPTCSSPIPSQVRGTHPGRFGRTDRVRRDTHLRHPILRGTHGDGDAERGTGGDGARPEPARRRSRTRRVGARSARCAAAPAAAAGGEVSGGVDFMESYDLDDDEPGEGAFLDDYELDEPQL